MSTITDFVKPELLTVTVVLYFVGMWIKNSEWIKDKYIPLILGVLGISLAFVWVFATSSIVTRQDAALAVFTAVVQGILVAGLSTYVNQIFKQLNKKE